MMKDICIGWTNLTPHPTPNASFQPGIFYLSSISFQLLTKFSSSFVYPLVKKD